MLSNKSAETTEEIALGQIVNSDVRTDVSDPANACASKLFCLPDPFGCSCGRRREGGSPAQQV